MRISKLFACFCLLVTSFSASAATPFSADASDLWWNPDESGWGLNLAQQGNLIFATLYVYAADGRARWFVASDMQATQVPPDRPLTFAGTLYETTGPAFSGAFNPASVQRRNVGTISFEFTPPNTGRLTYAVDGVSVAKSVQRQTWRVNDLSGSYRGYRVIRPLNCAAVPNIVTQTEADLTVTQIGDAVTMTTRDNIPNCTYTGTYTQHGRLGEVTGSYTCTNSTSGLFAMTEVEVGLRGFFAKYSGSGSGCENYGHIGGVRGDVPQAQ